MSNKLSKILLGVDFSEPSLNAIHTATNLAVKENATLYLLHAHETIFEQIVLRRSMQENVSNSSSILHALAIDISRKSGVRTQVIEEEGHAAEIMLRNVVALNIDLVILGTYGASGFRNGYTGCTAYAVSKYAPCPVLLVPGGQQWTKFRKVIYPVRPVMTAMRHYPTIRRFIEKESTLQIFGLTRKGEERDENMFNETLSQFQDSLQADKITTSINWNTDNAVSYNILSQADKSRSDLIILTTAIDVSNKQFFIGPISHYIIHHSRVPVLVINKVHSHSMIHSRATS